MGLLSKTAQSAVAGASGGYLNPSKIASGSAVRFALLSDEPLEMYEVWGEDPSGKAKPFRFVEEPSPDDIAVEMGEDYSRRMNREGTAPEPVKFVIALPVYNYDTESVEVLSLAQKSLIRELDAISQTDDYEDILATDFTLSREGNGIDTRYKLLPVPRKKGADAKIADAWQSAQDEGFDIQELATGGNPFKPESK
jgi:hypothetical protein